MLAAEMYKPLCGGRRSLDVWGHIRFEIGHCSSCEVVRDVDVNVLPCVGACEGVRPLSEVIDVS